MRCLRGLCEGTSTANQPRWKLRLLDVESLELHVSMAADGDTAAAASWHQRNEPILTKREEAIRWFFFLGRPGRSATLSVVTALFKSRVSRSSS